MNLDLSADPCQNFYQYACGNWPEEHPKPDTASMNDWFSERQVRVSQNLRAFLKRNNTEDENEPLPVKQTRALYNACMDTDAMDSVGYEPVETFMQKIGFPAVPQFFTDVPPSKRNKDSSNSDNGGGVVSAGKLLGRIKRYYGKDILIGWDVYPDPRNRTAFRMAVGTPEPNGGLPLCVFIIISFQFQLPFPFPAYSNPHTIYFIVTLLYYCLFSLASNNTPNSSRT